MFICGLSCAPEPTSVAIRCKAEGVPAVHDRGDPERSPLLDRLTLSGGYCFRRRRYATSPRPVPSRSKVAGSGTVTTRIQSPGSVTSMLTRNWLGARMA